MKSSNCHKTASHFVSDLNSTWKYIIVVFLVYGFEEILRLQFFKCPCTNHAMYSLAMTGAPALFLLCAGFCGSSSYWQVAHTRRNITSFKLRINHCLKSLPSLFKPFLPVAVFVVVALMKGEYYVCAMRDAQSSNCLKNAPGPTESTDDIITIQSLYMRSQLLSCGVLAGIMIFTIGITSISRCFFQAGHTPDMQDFYLLENELILTAFREKLQESLAKEVERDIEEAFDGLDECNSVEMAFKQARELIRRKKSLVSLGRFEKLPKGDCYCDEEDQSAVRMIDSTL